MTVETEVDEQLALLHVRASEKLTHADYETWVPVADRLIAACGKIRILFEMHDFHGWTAGAMWSDLTFGIRHFRDIGRLALMGEKAWQKGIVSFCKPFVGARIRYFEHDERATARAWLLAEDDAPDGADVDFGNAPREVAVLLRTLGGDDGAARETARLKLVAMGSRGTGPLITAATKGGVQMRLEATQALAEIADPATAAALAGQFQDTFEIGWAAARGLAKLGRIGALATLHELIQHPGVHVVRVSAHHALREMHDADVRDAVAPVVTALADSAPAQEAPVAALAAVSRLGR